MFVEKHSQGPPLRIASHVCQYAEPFNEFATIVGEDPIVWSPGTIMSVHSIQDNVVALQIDVLNPVGTEDRGIGILGIVGGLAKIGG